MKSHTVHLTMNVPARMDFVNITKEVEKAVAAINPDELTPKQALELLYELRRLKKD